MSILGTGTHTTVRGLSTNTALTDYLREVAEPNRYKRYVLRQFGTEALQPAYMGNTIYAPSITNGVQNATAVDLGGSASGYAAASQAERQTPAARKLSFSSVSGELNYYMDVIGVSKVFAATATLRKYLERAAEFLMVGCAQTEEELEIWSALGCSNNSGAAPTLDPAAGTPEIMYQAPANDGAAWGAIAGTDYFIPETLAAIRRQHVKNKNPGFAKFGDKYPVVLGPDATYMLMTNIRNDNTNANLSFEADSMAMADKYKTHVVGDLLGCIVIECDSLPQVDDGASGAVGQPGAAGIDCEIGFSFSPDAFYVQEHATLNPQLYWSGFQVNTFTPVGEEATLGIDYMAGAFAGAQIATKGMYIPYPLIT